MSEEYAYNPDRQYYYAEQQRFTPGGFTPLKEYEALSRGSYTPLASTTEPGRWIREISSRGHTRRGRIQDCVDCKFDPQ